MYCFWVFFQVENGEANYEEYPIKIVEFITLETPISLRPELPSLKEIIRAERCDKGLAISTMTREDWGQIDKIEEAYYKKSLYKKSLQDSPTNSSHFQAP